MFGRQVRFSSRADTRTVFLGIRVCPWSKIPRNAIPFQVRPITLDQLRAMRWASTMLGSDQSKVEAGLGWLVLDQNSSTDFRCPRHVYNHAVLASNGTGIRATELLIVDLKPLSGIFLNLGGVCAYECFCLLCAPGTSWLWYEIVIRARRRNRV